ncbi:SUKH-4 family immunity protein [Streptomyces scopuliridis]|uniref:SUKH-4 family immunity protein n=1 Tax=Streptomyces scopuliridis TaxID=452529 RepID=UPI0036B71400
MGWTPLHVSSRRAFQVCSVDRVRWTTDSLEAVSHTGSRQFLAGEGVPKISLVFSATDPNQVAEWVQGSRRYVVLGDYTEDEHLVLDVDLGSVHFGAGATDPVWPVNSGIQEFVRCLEAVQRDFPYYPATAEPHEHAKVADRLEALLRQIDPASFEADGAFWASFVHDVSIGDFLNEDVDWWPPDLE